MYLMKAVHTFFPFSGAEHLAQCCAKVPQWHSCHVHPLLEAGADLKMGLGVRDAVNHEAQGSHICLEIFWSI